LIGDKAVAVEWAIMIEGRNEFGDTCRKRIRIDKSWESLFDGDIGLSIDDGKKIISALQSAVVNHEAATYSLSPGLPGRPYVPADLGLYGASDPNRLRHR
jgi:hypothetical protein